MLVQDGHLVEPQPPSFQEFREWKFVCTKFLGGTRDENETSDIDAGPGCQFNVRGDAIFLRDRRRSRLRIRLWPCLLLRAASARVLSGLCLRSCSGNRLLVDRRILVSLWRPLFLAARILGAPALSWRVLGWPALLRWPLLPRLLGTPVTNFIGVCAAS